MGSETSGSARSSALSSHPRAPPNASKVSSPGAELAISPWIGSKIESNQKTEWSKIQTHAYHHSHDPLKSTSSNDQKQIKSKPGRYRQIKPHRPCHARCGQLGYGRLSQTLSNSATWAYHTPSAKQDFWSPTIDLTFLCNPQLTPSISRLMTNPYGTGLYSRLKSTFPQVFSRETSQTTIRHLTGDEGNHFWRELEHGRLVKWKDDPAQARSKCFCLIFC